MSALKPDQVEILVEEISMERFLQGILPNILPEGYVLGINCFVRPHDGKSDLLKSLRKKARAFRNFHTPIKLVVLHDQDANDCVLLKGQLVETVRNENPDIPLLVRIVCRELENWYLGDLAAVERAYPESKATKFAAKAKFRKPDALDGHEEMKKFSPRFGKVSGASLLSTQVSIETNNSTSFKHFVAGLHQFLS